MRWRPADSVDVRTENAPAPRVVLTRRPSSRNVTVAMRRPLTVALTTRPAQPEGPRSCDRPERTASASTSPAGGVTAGGVTAGGVTAGGSAGGGLSGGGLSGGGLSGGGLSGGGLSGGGLSGGGLSGGGLWSFQQKSTWLSP